MTLLPTVEAFSHELLLLRDPSFQFQLRAFPFVVGFIEFGTLTMFHKVILGLARIVWQFFFLSSIVFFNAKSNNEIFDTHFPSFMLEVILEIFPSRGSFLNNSCHENFRLTSFPQPISHARSLEALRHDWP